MRGLLGRPVEYVGSSPFVASHSLSLSVKIRPSRFHDDQAATSMGRYELGCIFRRPGSYQPNCCVRSSGITNNPTKQPRSCAVSSLRSRNANTPPRPQRRDHRRRADGDREAGRRRPFPPPVPDPRLVGPSPAREPCGAAVPTAPRSSDLPPSPRLADPVAARGELIPPSFAPVSSPSRQPCGAS